MEIGLVNSAAYDAQSFGGRAGGFGLGSCRPMGTCNRTTNNLWLLWETCENPTILIHRASATSTLNLPGVV